MLLLIDPEAAVIKQSWSQFPGPVCWMEYWFRCTLRVILSEDLSKPLHVSGPIAGIGSYKQVGLSSWVDNSGQRWLLSTS